MSKTAKDFIHAARQDEDLRLEIENIGQDVSALLALAKSKGYDFSEAEFVTVIRAEGYEIETKLDDAELEAVAGGGLAYTDQCPTRAQTNCGEDTCDCTPWVTDWPHC